MCAVKHPQFHVLIRRDVIDQQRANLVPIRAPIAEIVFDHPLRKGFGFDWRKIRAAQSAAGTKGAARAAVGQAVTKGKARRAS